MPPAKPSLDLLRSLTDEHVLRALTEVRQLTRAELAARTGLSKPTVSDSVRRLCEAGLLVDTGERTTGRGRVGSYYGLAEDVGDALVVGVAPEGIVAERVDAHGDVTATATVGIPRPARAAQVVEALTAAVEAVQDGTSRRRPRLAVVSAADPVDRASGRLVHLRDSPFLIGELAPSEVLARFVDGPVSVDNDVNWAARAERDAAAGDPDLDDFVHLHLGEGLGCAVVSDGAVRRGHAGLAGEVAHVLVAGPGERAMPLIEVFDVLRLRRPSSTAIDVPVLLAAVRGDGPGVADVTTALARAVCGVLAAAVALSDPALVVLGGAWGIEPAVLDAVTAEFARLPRHVPVRAARLTDAPSLTGARTHALHELRTVITTAAPGRDSRSDA
ncbi:ROK family transcriptional regulator [Pseudonocardia broussonetiae]|uniref:ROK family transcriptional regulator n=1 Tax=Pseudonocardia broussonetiae TaxID=2736640 RepID=A0A6M6JEV9_9PSEU|nr:ROK family transcriptional regulator [Pseudonocardia broussonetiae]QJY45342.1 ROK family transcriptional regulator [Pseudonocardia broussonetiae]